MDKRDFLKTSGAFITGGMFSRLMANDEKDKHLKNWSGNYQYSTDNLQSPKSVAELQEVLKSCKKMKALGTRHSFNSIADTTGDQISLKNFKQMDLNQKSSSVSVGAGVKYGELAPYLYDKGYALHNLASLPHISVAGACATATHGSGNKNGNLSTAVSGLEIVTPDGELLNLSRERDGDRFRGAVVGLGGLGIVTKTTLDVQPAYDVRQVVYQNLSINQLEHNLQEIFASGYSVSLFTDWQNHRVTQVWIKSRVDRNASFTMKKDFFGAKLATEKLHPLAGHSAENCTEQMGIPGPWFERLPHFRMNFTPSSGDELQSEYFVPRDKAYEAVIAIERIRDHVTPHLMISELRTIEADELWMSPCYKRAAMTIHFTWKPEWPAVKKVLPLIEEQLAPFNARPHWAKLFTMAPSHLQSLYEKLPNYKSQLERFDPKAKARNAFLDTNLYNG